MHISGKAPLHFDFYNNQELSPSSHLDINVTQFDQYLIIEWTSPPSLSLTYEVSFHMHAFVC